MSVFFVFLQKTLLKSLEKEGKLLRKLFLCTPPEIVSAAKEPECTLPEHGLLFKNRNYCTFNINIVNT
jgi:hypothetical protein